MPGEWQIDEVSDEVCRRGARRMVGRGGSEREPGVAPEGVDDGGEKVEVGELFVDAVFGPGGFDAEEIAFLEPIGALFDGGLFEVVRERGLAGGGGVAGEDVAAGEDHARESVGSVERGA